jgi:hypothetical protein
LEHLHVQLRGQVRGARRRGARAHLHRGGLSRAVQVEISLIPGRPQVDSRLIPDESEVDPGLIVLGLRACD